MLSPNIRSLYTAALAPPPGMIFDEAIGTTFSMDPSMLLSVPVHLALLGGERGDPLRDGIAVLESVRRLSDRITVYAQRGRLQVPAQHNVLYGLLESMVVEVGAPRGGLFHPKLWVIRFADSEETDAPLLRLMILSRNLTADRSWDVALTLEGRPSGRNRAANRALGEFVSALPELAFDTVHPSRIEQASRLGDELRRTKWELPPDFEEVAFHILGINAGSFKPSTAKRCIVISPFCTDSALQMLTERIPTSDALISRPETLAELSEETRSRFGQCYVLSEAAETEDGESLDDTASHDTHGLHAKVYLLERGWNTHYYIGSANATNAAMLNAGNVEIMAELVGKRSRVGIDKVLSGEGLLEVLEPYYPPADGIEIDPDQKAADQALENARNIIVSAALWMKCTDAPVHGEWNLSVIGDLAPLEGIASAQMWPITVAGDRCVDMKPLVSEKHFALGTFAAASITGLVAVELRASAFDLKLRFVLNLPIEGLPEDRDKAVLQTVVRNQQGFLRYLLLLLGDLGYGHPQPENNGDASGNAWIFGGSGNMPLLEELVRAYSREPERLQEVARVVKHLTEGGDNADIVPAEFLEVWSVFEKAMEECK